MTVLVAIPYFGCADYIEQAVGCVLAQTYTDLVCLVAGDGETPPLVSKDDRLRVVAFPVNRGAPFTQQAMLLGNPYEWYAPHGADDWTDPEYLERLMELPGPAKASGAVWWHHSDASQELRRGDRSMVEFGIFETRLLRNVGGYGVDRRCGQDTLLYEDILPHVTGITWTTEAAYHKRIRAGSLTQNPVTGFGSAYRTEVVEHNRAVATQCAMLGFDPDAMSVYRERLVPMDRREELEARIWGVKVALS